MFVVKFLRKDPLWISINRGFISTESNVLNVYFDETQDNAFIGSTYDVRGLFQNCSLLSGIVPAEKLWDNSNITWVNTNKTFNGCSNEIREQVPTTWGGTKTN